MLLEQSPAEPVSPAELPGLSGLGTQAPVPRHMIGPGLAAVNLKSRQRNSFSSFSSAARSEELLTGTFVLRCLFLCPA